MAVSAPARPSVNHFPKAPPQDKAAVEEVAACVESFESGMGPDFRDRCERFYVQYRGFKKWRSAWEAAGPNDRDGMLHDAKKAWGANLHIPLSFRTIETMVPRAIAHAPRLLYMPREERWEEHVAAIRLLIDSQQQQIDIDLPFQAVMRSGRIYGLGVGKVFWRKEIGKRTVMQPRTLRRGEFIPKTVPYVEFDDPDFIDVDVFDFMWDPMGSAMTGQDRAKWVVHRMWLDLGGCLQRLRSGVWNSESARALLAEPSAEDKLRSMGNGQKYSEVWNGRMEASGFNLGNMAARGEQVHEVWEWHDGDRVRTVLDRCLLVQDAESPCCGTMPFQVYRPTPLQKQMVGIGDLEPLEHLQREMDTLRSQIIDAGTISLNAGYIYDDAMVDEEDLIFGPGAAIRVRNSGDIRNAIQAIQPRDVPGSAIERVQMTANDFDLVSGISDQADPLAQAAQTTATGAQLQQEALGQRILLGSRRFETEVVRNVARTFLRLNQRMIVSQRRPVREPMDGMDDSQASDTGRWKWFQIDPGVLQGEFEIKVEGGSMAARNVPQERQDAQLAMSMFGESPFVDKTRVVLYSLMKALDLSRSEAKAWLKQSDPPVPQAALKILESMGVNPDLIQQAVVQAQRSDPQLAPEVDQAQQQGQAA